MRLKIIKIGAVWCPGCLSMKKVWNKIKEDYPNIEISELDYDIDHDLVMKYNPEKLLPFTLFMDNNDNELERIVGERSVKYLEELIDKYEEN